MAAVDLADQLNHCSLELSSHPAVSVPGAKPGGPARRVHRASGPARADPAPPTTRRTGPTFGRARCVSVRGLGGRRQPHRAAWMTPRTPRPIRRRATFLAYRSRLRALGCDLHAGKEGRGNTRQGGRRLPPREGDAVEQPNRGARARGPRADVPKRTFDFDPHLTTADVGRQGRAEPSSTSRRRRSTSTSGSRPRRSQGGSAARTPRSPYSPTPGSTALRGGVLRARDGLGKPADPRRLARRDDEPARARAPGGQVQMIYIDPPYGINYSSNFQPSRTKPRQGRRRRSPGSPSRSRPIGTRGSSVSTPT